MKGLAIPLLALALAAGLLASPPGAVAQGPVRPVIVYINQGQEDDRYHAKGCTELKEGFSPISLQNAKNQGYKPCPVCKPPE